MTIGDFLDKHFWAIWWLGAGFLGVRLLLAFIVGMLGEQLNDD